MCNKTDFVNCINKPYNFRNLYQKLPVSYIVVFQLENGEKCFISVISTEKCYIAHTHNIRI